uniref:Tetraspanin n=1 Tax=Trichuris muris TaxID=70415 RepID=A0A5S6QRI3_TRIMR
MEEEEAKKNDEEKENAEQNEEGQGDNEVENDMGDETGENQGNENMNETEQKEMIDEDEQDEKVDEGEQNEMAGDDEQNEMANEDEQEMIGEDEQNEVADEEEQMKMISEDEQIAVAGQNDQNEFITDAIESGGTQYDMGTVEDTNYHTHKLHFSSSAPEKAKLSLKSERSTTSEKNGASSRSDEEPSFHTFGRVELSYNARAAIQHFLILIYMLCIAAMTYGIVISGLTIFDAVKLAPAFSAMHKTIIMLIVSLPIVLVWFSAGYALSALYGCHVRQLQRATALVFHLSTFVLIFAYLFIIITDKERKGRIIRQLMYVFEMVRDKKTEYVYGVNIMQEEFQCCGVINPRSWHNVGQNFSMARIVIKQLSIPWSCCIRGLEKEVLCGNGLISYPISDGFNNATLFPTGCEVRLDTIMNEIIGHMYYVTPAVAGVMLFTVLPMHYLTGAMAYLYKYCDSDTDPAAPCLIEW